MGYQYYVSFQGSKQGKIHGGSTNPRRRDWLSLQSVSCGIQLPWDVPPGKPAGKRPHHSIHITKEVDSASPLLFVACETREHFQTIVIEIVEVEANGWERPGHTVTLADAVILEAVSHIGHGRKPAHDFTIEFDGATVTPGPPSPALPWVRSWQGFDF